jgi:acetyl-CoA C-acetyltransferase
LAEAQAESGTIWSLFSQVANANPGAWIHKPASADTIVEPTADNRPIAHPYTKFMVANSSVNQGAAFLVTSLAEARRRGVAEDRLIYVGMGAAAHEPDDPLGRDRYDRSPSMAVSIRRTLDLNRMATTDLDHVELYSCFPCVPKMARRVLGWPVDRPATVFGGLTFGGGPIGNYMSHAVVSMVQKLRHDGRYGLLFANGGFATHNHTIIIGRDPIAAATFPQDFHFQGEADADRGAVPALVEVYEGPATIETYTVLYQRDGSAKWGVIVAKTPDGGRTLAKVPATDSAGIAFLTDGHAEPVGRSGEIRIDADGDQIWTQK